jgi:hypothetical protein
MKLSNIKHLIITIFIGLLLPYTQAWGMNLNDFLSDPLTPFIVKIQPGYILKKTLESRSVEKIIKAVHTHIGKRNIVSFDTPLLLDLIKSGGQSVAEHITECITPKNIVLIPQQFVKQLGEMDPKVYGKLKNTWLQFLEYFKLKNYIEYITETEVLDTFLFSPRYLKTYNAIKECLSILNFQSYSLNKYFNINLNDNYKVVETQSRGHAQQHAFDIQRFSNVIEGNKQLQMMLFAIHKQEEKEILKGKYPFYHGQKIEYWYRTMIFKRIMELVYDIKFPETYYPLRYKKFGNYISDDMAQQITQNGRMSWFDVTTRPHMIFMNHALFGNTNNLTSCSFQFFINNNNINSVKTTLRELFVEYALEDYFDNFKKEFEDLEKEMTNEKKGMLLLLSFTPEQIKKYVYYSEIGGFKADKITIFNKKTNDVLEILKSLRKHPAEIRYPYQNCDTMEYVAVLSDGPEGLLNPFVRNSLEIYWFTEGNMSPYIKKLDAIFEKIKSEIAYDGKVSSLLEQYRFQQGHWIKEFLENQQPKKSKL